ncbi:MAG: sulfotransferase family 2 domain-containing protein [Pseudomonadota bacterium]
MVIVSHSHAFLVLKTHKTASTSTEAALEHLCTTDPAGHSPAHSTSLKISEAGIIGSRAQPERTPWRNHMPAWKAALLLGPTRWRRYRKIAVLRNPFDRAVSLFFHRMTGAERDWASRASNVELVAAFRAWLPDQPLTENLDKLRILGRPAIDHYLYYETLAADLTALKTLLGDPKPLILPRYKGERRTNPLSYTAYYDADSQDYVARRNRYELRLGGYGLGFGPTNRAPP